MSADKIEISLMAEPISQVTGTLDFREKEAWAFPGWQLESMHKKACFNLLLRGEGSAGITCEHMDFVPPFAKLLAELISDPSGSADGVWKENVCQH